MIICLAQFYAQFGFMYSAEAEFFLALDLRGPIGARPRVRPLGPPPTHHDLMKIY